MRGLLVAFALLFLFSTNAFAQSPVQRIPPFVRAHRAVDTSSTQAQAAFDDGLTLLYAYNPEAARAAFERAIAADPALGIAWWGVAMSYGPNINTDYDANDAKNGNSAASKALNSNEHLQPVDRALAEAVRKRYAAFHKDAASASARAYADAMVAAAAAYSDDDDVQTLTAEAAMDVRPWSYYKDDGTPEAGTQAIVDRLQLVLARNPAHIGAEHFLIHATEESKHPELALDGARRLADDSFEPGAEHLTHMPAHTFERVGEFHEAGVANARAVDALIAFLAQDPSAAHGGYLGHDCLFGVDAFMMSGEHDRALALAETCAQHDAGRDLIRIVQYRFHRWDALDPKPTPGFFTTMARLRAHDVSGAERESKSLASQDSSAAKIEGALVSAAIAHDRGDAAAELASLSHAVSVQDESGYSEPPAFWFPVREALGAAQLRDASARDAAATFTADLEKNPGNARSYFGLATALDRIGDTDGARDARERYESAWSHADTPLKLEDL